MDQPAVSRSSVEHSVRISGTDDIPYSDMNGFVASLQTSRGRRRDAPAWQEKTQAALDVVRKRVEAVAASKPQYADWAKSRADVEGTLRHQLIKWRTLEILIARQQGKKQMNLLLEPLSTEELDDKDESDVRAAAELLLSKEFGFPYYFGLSKLAGLGSFNVEQFIRLAGDLFEESLAAAVMRRRPQIAPERQERIIQGAYDTRVKDLPRRAKNGRDVLRFLDAVGQFCRDVTHQPNAPYSPGVTGIAILMQERETLLDPAHLAKNPPAAAFAAMLGTAIAHNLLHAEVDYKVKGNRYMVLYLNRLLCPKYELPLQFGGFREKRRGTPIIVQENYLDAKGRPRHRFSRACPVCGATLPAYRPLLTSEAGAIAAKLPSHSVFYFDRVAPGTLELAQKSRTNGALVVFEPSGIKDERLFAECLKAAHVVKYANDRIEGIHDVVAKAKVPVEIETLGAKGLRLRVRTNGRLGAWKDLPAFSAPELRDAAGAGDWTTAGLIHGLMTGGSSVEQVVSDADAVVLATGLGQALAALNCGFEGARGLMYAADAKRVLDLAGAVVRGTKKPSVEAVQSKKRTNGHTDKACLTCSGARALHS